MWVNMHLEDTRADVSTDMCRHMCADMPKDMCADMRGRHVYTQSASSISAPYRHRRRHVYCAGIGVPVLKMTASENDRLSEAVILSPGTPIPVGDADIEPVQSRYRAPDTAPALGESAARPCCGTRTTPTAAST